MPPKGVQKKYRPKPKVPYGRLAEDFRDIVCSLDHAQSRRLIHEVADEMRELIVQVRDSVDKYSSETTLSRAHFALFHFKNNLGLANDEVRAEWEGNGRTDVDILKDLADAFILVGKLWRKVGGRCSLLHWDMKQWDKMFPGRGFDLASHAIRPFENNDQEEDSSDSETETDFAYWKRTLQKKPVDGVKVETG
jgi:hypothetical protein